MSDTIVARGSALPIADDDGVAFETALESRAEVPALAALHHERRALLAEHAGLMALYGNFGLYDDRRKACVEAQKVIVRQQLSAGNEKTTEGRIDSEAYGSKTYQDFLDRAYEDKVRWIGVQNRLDEIAEIIRSRELAIMAYSAEIRLTR